MIDIKKIKDATFHAVDDWFYGREGYVEKLESDRDIRGFMEDSELSVRIWEALDIEDTLYELYGEGYDLVGVGMIDLVLFAYLKKDFNDLADGHNYEWHEYEQLKKNPSKYYGVRR